MTHSMRICVQYRCTDLCLLVFCVFCVSSPKGWLIVCCTITCVVTFTAVEARPMHYAVYGKPDLNQTVSYADDSDVTGENLLAFNRS